VHVSAVGGLFTCGYCRNSIEVRPRPGPAATGQAITEDQRVYELARQLGACVDDRQNWSADFVEVARGGATERP
jgi:hypothetical protein